jgi:hypothetical protein
MITTLQDRIIGIWFPAKVRQVHTTSALISLMSDGHQSPFLGRTVADVSSLQLISI